MDRYDEGAYAQADGGPTKPHDGGPSVDGRAPQTPRLQKKKSSAGVRSASQPLRNTFSYAGDDDADYIDHGAPGTKAPRKGSLRNAIRRVFGRRSRVSEPAPSQISPPRHAYHRSEPVSVLPSQPEEPERHPLEPRMSQRNFSVPLDMPPAAMVPRTRSPYAVEFPQSSRLKPLNLGNPFDAPGSQLRRRKTLPSVLVTAEDAAAIKASMESTLNSVVQEAREDPSPSQIGRAISTKGSDKRRSRSESDLRGAGERPQVPQRKRSDEIRYWRQSYQPNVLRASGFRMAVDQDAEGLGAADVEQDIGAARLESRDGPTPQTAEGLNASNVDDSSLTALGTELSRDLEDRVARLETGLRNFQSSLEKLNADRNRRTILVANTPEPGSVPVGGRRGRAASNDRTPSLLAGDLQGDLAPSNYQYDYTDTFRARPSTSPQPPQTPPAGMSRNSTLPIPEPRMDDPFITPSPPLIPGAERNAQRMPQHTFRSLYEMLADERSARRRLEQTMRNLQDEIANLNYQVSTVQSSSTFPASQRSSYMPSSTRLQALLAGTEESPPGTSESQRHRFAGLSIDPRVVSRFSGSESEAAPTEAGGMDTPYEVFQTPAEEQSPARFVFGPPESQGYGGQQRYGSNGARADGDMF